MNRKLLFGLLTAIVAGVATVLSSWITAQSQVVPSRSPVTQNKQITLGGDGYQVNVTAPVQVITAPKASDHQRGPRESSAAPQQDVSQVINQTVIGGNNNSNNAWIAK